VFDKQTNMAENKGKRLKHEPGRKLALLASKSLAHLKPCAREMTRQLPTTAMLSNTVTLQTQFSSPVSRDTFIGKLAVFRLQKNHPNYFFFLHFQNSIRLLHISRKENTLRKFLCHIHFKLVKKKVNRATMHGHCYY